MDNTKILKMINENRISELKEMLQHEIMLEGIKNTSDKLRQQKIQKHFLKECKSRPVLQKYIIKNDIQYFTDSYFLVALVEEDQIQSLKEYNPENDGQYPELDYLINNAKKSNRIYFELEYNELINQIKLAKANKKETFDVYVEDNRLLVLGIKELEVFLLSMNYKKNDTLKVYTDTRYNKLEVGLNVYKDNGSYGLLLPCRQPIENEVNMSR